MSNVAQTVPFALKCIEACRANATKNFYFRVCQLDEIVAGKNLEAHAEMLLDGTYLEDFLPSLNMWIEIAKGLVSGRSDEIDLDPSDPELAAFQKAIPRMVNEILRNYVAALEAIPDCSGDNGEDRGQAGLELLRCYHLFTQSLRDRIRETWPHCELDEHLWLTIQP